MFRCGLHSPDGHDLGEATYAMMIQPGEEIQVNGGQRARVIDVVPFDPRHTRIAWLSEIRLPMRPGMRQAGIEPATSRSGGARSIP